MDASLIALAKYIYTVLFTNFHRKGSPFEYVFLTYFATFKFEFRMLHPASNCCKYTRPKKKCSKSLNQEVSCCFFFFHSHKVRKKTFRGLYTKWDSFTPRKYKINIIRTLTHRMLSLLQDLRPFVVAAICLRRLLLQNGYPQDISHLLVPLTMLQTEPLTSQTTMSPLFLKRL